MRELELVQAAALVLMDSAIRGRALGSLPLAVAARGPVRIAGLGCWPAGPGEGGLGERRRGLGKPPRTRTTPPPPPNPSPGLSLQPPLPRAPTPPSPLRRFCVLLWLFPDMLARGARPSPSPSASQVSNSAVLNRVITYFPCTAVPTTKHAGRCPYLFAVIFMSRDWIFG